MTSEKELELSWDHIYLLAWWGEDGTSHLTTWQGDAKRVFVVTTKRKYMFYGVPSYSPPLWSAPVGEARLICFVPEGLDHKQMRDFAKSKGGVLALGWYLDNVERKEEAKP